jgi:very-short-patch-repair endonuclease
MQHISAAMSGSRGIRQVRCVIADIDARAESAGETLTRLLVQDLNIPMPQLQVPVRSRGGSYRLDFAWPDLKVALEFDGDSKYFDYRPTPQVLLRERKRERELMEDGWVFVRLEWKDLFWPEQVEARIRAAFARASRLNA